MEGTNYGLKHASVSTHPGLSMDNSMVILSIQSDKHVMKTNGVIIQDNKRHSLNYMNNVHDKLTIIAASILSTLFSHVKRYKTKRIKEMSG